MRWLAPALLLLAYPLPADAQTPPTPSWVWLAADGGTPPAGSRYFRKTFTLDRGVDAAELDITADNGVTVWLNGKEIGSHGDWHTVKRFDVKDHIVVGKNVLAVTATNEAPGSAGLLVKFGYVPKGQTKLLLVSDATWKSAGEAADGWQTAAFADAAWKPVKVLGAYGMPPWGKVTWEVGGGERFSVPAGFHVDLVVSPGHTSPDPKLPLSFVNMCFDAKGRLLVSQERGPVLLCTDADAKGVCKTVRPYCSIVKNCQGMCWVRDALLLVGDGPKGTGLYRCRDTKGTDTIDAAELMLTVKGSMGEHGPHAIIHGPDDQLYFVIGNHAWVKAEGKLAANSPLRRWPTGQMGPDQNKPNTTEDVLLPRLNDARGHAADILAPGGTIWRMDHDGKNLALVAAGFRNHFDAAFNPDGELFSYDSDMEWDENLPWYRAVAALHCPPGADFVWRTGAANTPRYYLDSLPALVETGRGSPVGVEGYDHSAFGPERRGTLFMADWSLGIIYAIKPKAQGASYQATAEKFVTGAPLNVTDVAVGPDGALYFTLGGRGSAGGAYRVVADKPGTSEAGRPDQPLAAYTRAKTPVVWDDPFQKMPPAKLIDALRDGEAVNQRKACAAISRRGLKVPAAALKPLLGSKDRFVVAAARLVLERIPPEEWATDFLAERSESRIPLHAIVALCHLDKANDYKDAIFALLPTQPLDSNAARACEMVLCHATPTPEQAKLIAEKCLAAFPATDDAALNRELAILLGHFGKLGVVQPQAKFLTALDAATKDRQQQIHYFYCLRIIKNGWTPEQKAHVLAFYDGTRTWSGGHSYTPFLENILRDLNAAFTPADRAEIFANAAKMPHAAGAMFRFSKPEDLPAPAVLAKAARASTGELRDAILEALGRDKRPDAHAALRELASDPKQLLTVARALAQKPTADDFPILVSALNAAEMPTLGQLVAAVKDSGGKPKPEDGAAFRALLVASAKLPAKQRWQAVEVLRGWTGGKKFGAENGDWKPELRNWGRWFAQSFPKEAALPDLASDKPPQSKYAHAELVAYLTQDPVGKAGDVARGRVVFEKALCTKCHKYGAVGDGVGPDLSNVSKRFQRDYLVEAMLAPSKVISDQYRSTTIVTRNGKRLDGLVAVQGDVVTVLQQDATKVTLRKDEIEEQYASLVSVMPEQTLDKLTKQEIADLFAFMESDPTAVKTSGGGR